MIRVSEDLVFHAPAIDSLKHLLAITRDSHSRWPSSKSGPGSRENTQFHCSNGWIVSESPGASVTRESCFMKVRHHFCRPRYNQFVAYTVTLIPGDGIGPEVADAAVRAVDATGVQIKWHRVELTSHIIENSGQVLPSTFWIR